MGGVLLLVGRLEIDVRLRTQPELEVLLELSWRRRYQNFILLAPRHSV
jgi:hypothetical protein